jgi:uncharacterized membrane protein HdeD (DUF308 family)
MMEHWGPKGIYQNLLSTFIGLVVLIGGVYGIVAKWWTIEQVWPGIMLVLGFLFYKGNGATGDTPQQ